MEYYNKMNIEMANNAAAQKAFEILKDTLANGNYDTDYRCEPSIKHKYFSLCKFNHRKFLLSNEVSACGNRIREGVCTKCNNSFDIFRYSI